MRDTGPKRDDREGPDQLWTPDAGFGLGSSAMTRQTHIAGDPAIGTIHWLPQSHFFDADLAAELFPQLSPKDPACYGHMLNTATASQLRLYEALDILQPDIICPEGLLVDILSVDTAEDKSTTTQGGREAVSAWLSSPEINERREEAAAQKLKTELDKQPGADIALIYGRRHKWHKARFTVVFGEKLPLVLRYSL